MWEGWKIKGKVDEPKHRQRIQINILSIWNNLVFHILLGFSNLPLKIVVDSWKFSMLLLYILCDD